MASKETTTTYRWADGNVITRVDVREDGRGHAVAYMYANPSEDVRAQRQEIRAALRLKGWGTLSDHRGDEFLLRVSGLASGQELLSLLQQHQFVEGRPSVSAKETAAPPQPKDLGEFIRSNSLRASGLFYSFGNAIYIGSGIARSRAEGKLDVGQIGTGLAFATGDALIATVGGKDDSRQFASLLTKLRTHYEKEGIEIPKNAAIHVETSDKDKGFGEKIYNFLHEYVNPIKCASEVVGAFFYYNAGKQQKNVWKQATAVIFGTGFGLAGIIPEKKIDEEKYASAGFLEKAWMKIQSNPLSLGGISGYSNTVLTTFGAYKERKIQLAKPDGGNKLYRWDFAAPATMLFGNSLYAVSKKTVGGDIKAEEMISDVYSVAAQILNKQPEGTLRDRAIESTVKFLGERPEIRDTHQEIIVRLKQEMDIQRKNPWFEKVGLAPYTPVAHKPRVRLPGMETGNFSPGAVVQAKDAQLGGVTAEQAQTQAQLA